MAVQQKIYFEYSEIEKLVCPFEKRPFVFSYKPIRLTEVLQQLVYANR